MQNPDVPTITQIASLFDHIDPSTHDQIHIVKLTDGERTLYAEDRVPCVVIPNANARSLPDRYVPPNSANLIKTDNFTRLADEIDILLQILFIDEALLLLPPEFDLLLSQFDLAKRYRQGVEKRNKLSEQTKYR